MAVHFIETWDFHQELTGSNNGLTQDYQQYWQVSSTQIVGFATGYSEGQAIQIDHGTPGTVPLFTRVTSAVPQAIGERRVIFWCRFSEELTGTSYRCLAGFNRATLNEDVNVQIAANGEGDARLALGNFASVDTFLTDEEEGVFTEDWACYELYESENGTTVDVEFWKNGNLILSAQTATVRNPSGDVALVFNRPGNQFPQIDHVIVTDGERLPTGDQLHAVAIGASFEGDTGGSSSGFKGNLIIDGNAYHTAVQEQSLDSGNDADQNYAPATYFLYPVNPATGIAWTPASFDNIDAFGLCTDGTDEQRLTSLALLSVVNDSETGFPIITKSNAGAAVYLSGPWVKTDEDISYGGHLSDIPHSQLRSTDEYLTIDDLGCLLFSYDASLMTFGITFAEEYREDFEDWVTVTGGEPFVSYFISGYTILGDSNKKFQSNYVTVNYEDVPIGGAYLQGVWDYSLDGNTGRWSVKQQVYNDKGNYKHQQRKLKVRGHGTALQFRISSEQNKDFKINGWAIQASSNTGV